jgi:hypothetical protein
MSSEFSANFACGQILFSLKSSKLNYVVKETPHSAYITIRKKFLRSSEQSEIDNIIKMLYAAKLDEDIKDKLQKVEKENVNLKQRNKDVESDLGLLRIEFEEIENRNHELLNKNTDLDDKIEELYGELSYLREKGSNDKLVKLANENKILNARLKNAEECNIESTDTIEILESNLRNREHDVEKLKAQNKDLENENQKIRLAFESKDRAKDILDSDEDTPSTSKCGKCDYESDGESDMRVHMESHHETRCSICDYKCLNKLGLENHMEKKHMTICVKGNESATSQLVDHFECKNCNLTCKTEDKLENHMCRIEVKNPSFCDFYTKNWIALNRCSYVFHRIEKVEVAVLHCKDCTENKNRCSEKFPLYLPAQEDETNGLWHLDLSKYLEDGRLYWQAIKMLVKTEH